MGTAAICMPVGLLQAELCWGTLVTIGSLNEMGITNQVGVGIAGGQMPGYEHIRLSYVLEATSWGQGSAIINPGIDGLIADVPAMGI